MAASHFATRGPEAAVDAHTAWTIVFFIIGLVLCVFFNREREKVARDKVTAALAAARETTQERAAQRASALAEEAVRRSEPVSFMLAELEVMQQAMRHLSQIIKKDMSSLSQADIATILRSLNITIHFDKRRFSDAPAVAKAKWRRHVMCGELAMHPALRKWARCLFTTMVQIDKDTATLVVTTGPMRVRGQTDARAVGLGDGFVVLLEFKTPDTIRSSAALMQAIAQAIAISLTDTSAVVVLTDGASTLATLWVEWSQVGAERRGKLFVGLLSGASARARSARAPSQVPFARVANSSSAARSVEALVAAYLQLQEPTFDAQVGLARAVIAEKIAERVAAAAAAAAAATDDSDRESDSDDERESDHEADSDGEDGPAGTDGKSSKQHARDGRADGRSAASDKKHSSAHGKKRGTAARTNPTLDDCAGPRKEMIFEICGAEADAGSVADLSWPPILSGSASDAPGPAKATYCTPARARASLAETELLVAAAEMGSATVSPSLSLGQASMGSGLELPLPHAFKQADVDPAAAARLLRMGVGRMNQELMLDKLGFVVSCDSLPQPHLVQFALA